MKHKNVAITEAARNASLAGRALMALETEGARIASELNGQNRSLQLVSTGKSFSALIKHGNTTMQFEGDSFAVTTHD
jgi:hypothetical protein